MNSCNFVGRLTADPELRRTNDGTPVCSYSLAVKRPMVKDATDFIECVSWRQSAEYLSQYAHKGDVVAVSGSLQVRNWTDKDGNKHKTSEIITTSVELLSSKRNSETANNTAQNQNGYPGRNSDAQRGYNQHGFGGYQGNFTPAEYDDPKLPF